MGIFRNNFYSPQRGTTSWFWLPQSPSGLYPIVQSLLIVNCFILLWDLGLEHSLHGIHFKWAKESGLGPGNAPGGLQSSAHVKRGERVSLENSKRYWKESPWKLIQHFPLTEVNLHSLPSHRINDAGSLKMTLENDYYNMNATTLALILHILECIRNVRTLHIPNIKCTFGADN